MLFTFFTIPEALLVWEITGSVKSCSYRKYFESFVIFFCAFIIVNPIQDGGAKEAPPASFSPVISTNVGFGPQNFLTFSFNPFATLV